MRGIALATGLFLSSAIAGPACLRADDAPASQPARVTAAQLIACLPPTIGPLTERDPTEIVDPSGMDVPGCTAHYKISDDRPDFGDAYLRDYGNSDFNRQRVDMLVGLGKTVDDASGTMHTITIDGYPAVERIAKSGHPLDLTVVVNKRFVIIFQSAQMDEPAFKKAVEAYDFKKLAALGE